MAVSLLCFEAAKKEGLSFEAVAGHSLGEYAAMVASGMLSLEDGFKVIKARAEAFDKVASSANGAMAAVLKLTADEVREVCDATEGYVVPVNYNSPVQTVIAGEADAVARASAVFKEKKARVMPLNTESAFHSEIMKPASEDFYENIKDITFTASNAQRTSYRFLRNLKISLTEMTMQNKNRPPWKRYKSNMSDTGNRSKFSIIADSGTNSTISVMAY